ncbi:MAG: ATP-binding protein [Anaerolineae bacterium]
MRRLKTLRARFALWIAGLFLAVLITFGLLVYLSMAQGLAASFDDTLSLGASQVIAGLEVEQGKLVFPEDFATEPENADLRARGFTVRVFNPDGQLMQAFGPYQTLPLSPQSLVVAIQRQPTFDTLTGPTDQAQIRVYTAPVIDNQRVVGLVQVAQTLADLQATLRRLLLILLVSGPLLVMVAGGSGYFLAARALAPIDQITRTAQRISVNDLSARLNLPPTADEVGRLATTFDSMLARLDESFRRERQFTADAAHELRTPLSAMQAILELILEKRRTPADYERALVDLAGEAERLRTLTEGLILLARGDMTRLALTETVDLSSLLHDVAGSLGSLAEAKGLALTCTVPAGLTLTGDSDSLIRLFVNLLGNAIKYTEQGGITVSAAQGMGDALTVAIADTGLGIPPEHLPHIFDRFYRGDQSRTTPGAGLGLAIALEIARAHGGTIEVSSQVGRGTTFQVKFNCSPDLTGTLRENL